MPTRSLVVPALVIAFVALGAPAPAAPEAAPCDVPVVSPHLARVDGGPDAAIAITFRLAEPATAEFEAWFALRSAAADPALPAERANAAGFLEAADGTAIGTVGGMTAIYPYGAEVAVAGAAARVAPADAEGCWGAFGGSRAFELPAGEYRFVVIGASEAGSRFAAFLPAEAEILAVATGAATRIDTAAMTCDVKAHAFVSGVLAEVLRGCATPLAAEGRAYRAVWATWGPTSDHDVRWTTPAGAHERCYKAPNWCVDVASGAGGAWSLDVPRYVTLRQPLAAAPVGIEGWSGIFGVFAGLPR